MATYNIMKITDFLPNRRLVLAALVYVLMSSLSVQLT